MKLRARLLTLAFLIAALVLLAGCRDRGADGDDGGTPTVEVPAADTGGDSGDAGDTGDSDAGDAGDSGDAADAGDSGDAGDAGDNGDGGDAGDAGDSGDAGGADAGDDGGQPAGNPYVQPEIVLAASAGAVTPGSNVSHLVVDGDWLLNIARCYGVPYAALRAANPGIFNPERIYPGSTVTVPNAGSAGPIIGAPCVISVTVAEGDTFEGLAAAYGVSSGELRAANPGQLRAGQEIIVPNLVAGAAPLPVPSHDALFSWEGDLAFWDADTGEQLEMFLGHRGWVWSVEFSPDSRMALSGGGGLYSRAGGTIPGTDFAIRLWKLPPTTPRVAKPKSRS